MVATFFFITGLFFGSFLNVLIYRLPRDQKWVTGRSRCIHCKKNLAWYDLLPLVSWLILQGKCRQCGKAISPIYPIVELLNASVWAFVAWGAETNLTSRTIGPSLNLSGIGSIGWFGIPLLHTAIVLILASTLIVIFFIDIQHYIIPDETVIVMTGLGIFLLILNFSNSSTQTGLFHNGVFVRLIWAFGSSAFFYFLHKITKGKGMGWGDIKLVFPMGLILGNAMLVALFSSFVIGAVVGVYLLATKIRKLKQPIPFGPFLVIGIVIALIFGNQVIQWYLGGII